ncbi:MAG: hypothetical protein ACXVCP_02200 [Bdellovibrio sp.]
MKKIAFTFITGLFFLTIQGQAKLNLVSVSGDSAHDLSNRSAPIIYAGFTPGCKGDGINTCDSCNGEMQMGAKIWSCNKRNAYPELVLTVRLRTTEDWVNAENTFITIGGERHVPSISPIFSDGILTVKLPWSEICNSPTVSQGPSCGGSFSTDLEIGFESSHRELAKESLTLRIRTRAAAKDGSDWIYSDCRSSSNLNEGACYFRVLPGYKKLYASDLTVSEGFPSTNVAGVTFEKIVFFYEAALKGEDDITTLGRISNKSQMVSSKVNFVFGIPQIDNRITGLKNNVRYCVVMANQDVTGIISHFTPIPSAQDSTIKASELCAKPSP